MLFDIFFFFLLLQLNICNEKKICITKDSQTSSYQCSTTIDGITSDSDITSEISQQLEDSDTEITLYLIGSGIKFNFHLNIFNNKKLYVQLDSETIGNFDVSEINNIDMNFLFTSSINSLPTINLIGSSLNDDQSSMSIKRINLETSIGDIQLKSFSTESSTFSFPSIQINSLKIISATSTELTINNNNNVVFGSQTITFYGEAPSLTVDFTINNFPLIINNQMTSTASTLTITASNAKSVTFNGNDFSQSNSITLSQVATIISNVGFLPISANSFSSDANLYVKKDSTIEGSFAISTSRNLLIGIEGEQPTSRIQVKIALVTLETGKIQLSSSWIDLIIDDFQFKSAVSPFIPCIGYGGSSTLLANKITLDSQGLLAFNSISINLDISQDASDSDLANLVNSEKNILIFKSFTQATPVDDFETITFNPSNIYGFGSTKSSRIISVKSSVSLDYIVTLTASSLDSIAYVVCLGRKQTQCTDGTAITAVSDIPNDKKNIKIKINKGNLNLDLDLLNTKNAVVTIEKGNSNFPILGLTMGDVFPNPKISHLIFDTISFSNSENGFNFNSKQVTFRNCKQSSLSVMTFNEQTIVNIDQISFNELNDYVTGSFPSTNILTPIQSSSVFEITESDYIFTVESGTISYSKSLLPKVSYQIELTSNDNYNLQYKTAATEVDSVDLLFVSSQQINPQITVSFENLNTVTKANKIGLDFGTFNSGNTVDFKTNTEQSFVVINGENVKILPEKNKPNGKICVCKTPPSSLCEEDFSQITYSDLEKSIQDYTGDTFKIIVVGEQDNSPILPIGLLNNKDATIVGVGINPKILIDCSSEYNDDSKTLEFSNIAVSYSTGNNLHISNLKLLEKTTIDSSFNSISLTVGNLECDVSQLGFQSISVQKSLTLSGDAINSISNSKVTFAAASTFTFTLPESIKISGSSLVFNNLEFDLTNVSPIFSLSSNEFIIDGTDGNIDSIGSDIVLQSDQLNQLNLIGNWANQNPTKFIVFKDFSSAISINSQNAPINIEYASANNILIGNEQSSIAGVISLPFNGFYDIIVSTSVTGKASTLQIKEIDVVYKESSGTVNIKFETSNININIETLLLQSKFRIINFNMLIDLDYQNQVTIVNAYDESRNQALKYNVECTVTENINDPRMKNFISNDHILMIVNNENTIKSLNKEVTFNENAPVGFNTNNFKLKIEANQLIFYTENSPLEGETVFYYGNCPDTCEGTQIKNEDLSSIEKLISNGANLALITFYESIPENLVLDFDKQDFSIEYLTLKSNNNEIRNANIKFGQCISKLDIESVEMKNDATDAISIQEVTLSKGSSFSQEANINGVGSMQLDQESLFASCFTDFTNSLLISLESSDVTLTYTSFGMKLANAQSKEFSIDVSKMPKVSISIRSKETPKINLGEGVTELKQIYSLDFDSTLIRIGSGWNSLLTQNPIVKYTIEPQTTAISVITDSFPFEAWDLMTKYTIQLSNALTPFTYSEKYTISNKNLVFNTYSPSASTNYDITFDELVMNGESSIKSIDSEQSNKKLIIKEIKTDKGSSSQLTNAIIQEEIELNQDSSLNGDFNLAESFSEIDINWDLNEVPLLNPSSLQTSIPAKININFIGRSIEGREEAFKEFLSNGVVILKNFDSCSEIIQNIHYKSETVDEFKDGELLSLKCQCVNENEIQLLYIEKPPVVDSSDDTEPPSEIVPTLRPTPPQTLDGPTVDYDSYTLKGNTVEFTKDGYNDSGNKYVTERNENEILLLNLPSSSVTATTTKDEPESDIYISPNNKNANIQIPQTDFEFGQIGVHANSNNPTVTLSSSNVPLKIFNNEKSDTTLNVDGNSLTLKKAIINNGELNLNLPNSVTEASFENVIVYQTSQLNTKAELSINNLDMKAGSTITFAKSKFGKKIKSAPRSKLVINEKATFNEDTEIDLTESSFIELGNSVIEGICKKIKLQETRTDSNRIFDNDDDDDHEIEIPLICGANFDCASWVNKYEGDRVFTSAKCIQNKDNKMCLVASSKDADDDGKDDDDKKKSLPIGAIIGICISAVVVVIVIIVTIVICTRKKTNKTKTYSNFGKNDNLEDIDSRL